MDLLFVSSRILLYLATNLRGIIRFSTRAFTCLMTVSLKLRKTLRRKFLIFSYIHHIRMKQQSFTLTVVPRFNIYAMLCTNKFELKKIRKREKKNNK